MSNFYGATGLIGGAVGALDKIDGAGLSDKDAALVVTGTKMYTYFLNATSGAAESSPDVIKPDTNAGDKRWILKKAIMDYADITGNDGDTDVTGAELEELTDASETTLHNHAEIFGFYGATSLIGGGAGALDAVDGAVLSDGAGAIVITADMVYVYSLNATSGAAESSPAIIAPDDNPGDKRWILVGAVFGKTVTFAAEINNGDSGAAKTISWAAGNKQKSTLTDNCTFTFDPEPDGPCNLILKLVQGGGGSYTVTWPADVKWPGGTAPTLSTGVGEIDLISFYYDGADFHGQLAANFS